MANAPSTAARRYAEAAFELAERDDALDAYADGLDLAVQMLAGEAARDIVRNPARALRERLEFVNGMLEKRVPEPVRKLVGLLVQRGRIDQLPRVGGVPPPAQRPAGRGRGARHQCLGPDRR